MKQMLIFLATGLFCLLLLGCGEETAVPTPTPLAQLPTETASQTPSPIPTNTVTPTPNASQPKPATPTIQPTSSVTPSPTPIHLDIPSWVIDPTVNVFLVVRSTDRGSKYVVTLFNSQTAESFDIPFSKFVSPSWVWQEGELYLRIYHGQSSGQGFQEAYQEFINLTTGEITTPPLNSSLGRVVKSPDNQFMAQIIESDTPPQATITEIETETKIELQDPFNGRYHSSARALWSLNSKFLAIHRVSFHELAPTEHGLAIYTLTGEIFRQYEDFRFIQWSPLASSQLLYWGNSNDVSFPCVLDIVENTSNCLEEIASWSAVQNVNIARLAWSIDGTKISFLHWNYETNNNGLCFIEISNEEIHCLVTPSDLMLDSQMYPTDYFWSPDGRYAALFIDPAGLGSDDRSFTSVALVDSNGQNFRVFDLTTGLATIPSITTDFWRPPINP